jgi:hypothetical protein
MDENLFLKGEIPEELKPEISFLYELGVENYELEYLLDKKKNLLS